MSFLTDTDLELRICEEKNWTGNDKIHIFPYSEDCLTPVGYDLRVGQRYSSSMFGGPFNIEKDAKLRILHGDTMLIETMERIGMPKDRSLSGLVNSMVSIVSQGLSHVSTTIDADWNGKLLIALTNHSKHIIELTVGQTFCTVVFFENKSPATRSWEKEPGRSDILLKNLASSSEYQRKKMAKKQKIKIGLLFGTPFLFLVIGYWIFGNAPGIIAMTALGGFLAQILSNHIAKY